MSADSFIGYAFGTLLFTIALGILMHLFGYGS